MGRINSIKLLIMVLALTSCQGQNKKEDKTTTVSTNSSKESKLNDTMVKEVLKSQLADGKEIGGDEYESHTYTEKDLEATFGIVQDELTKNGYKFPSQKDFNAQIKNVFNRTIDNSSAKKELYVNFDDACKRDPIYSRIKVVANGTYVVKNSYFITDLYAIPELIDYQSKFPDLNAIEDQKISEKRTGFRENN